MGKKNNLEIESNTSTFFIEHIYGRKQDEMERGRDRMNGGDWLL